LLNRQFPDRRSIRRASLISQLLNYRRREFRRKHCAGIVLLRDASCESASPARTYSLTTVEN